MASEINYSDILRTLNDGYFIEDLENQGISKEKIKEFLDFLNEKDLTIENAKALNIYSNGSNMILGIKKEVVSKEVILENICKDTTESLLERKVSKEDISSILEFAQGLDYSKPLYENYMLSKAFVEEHNLPKVILPSFNTCIKRINSLERIDFIIEQIDDVLDKATLDKETTLYRGLKLNEEQIEVMKRDGNLKNIGYTSTAKTYDSSFIKYDYCNVGLIMHCEEGTKGIDIAPFSDYDSSEQEILLAPNNFEVSNFSEVNGKLIFEGDTRDISLSLEL